MAHSPAHDGHLWEYHALCKRKVPKPSQEWRRAKIP